MNDANNSSEPGNTGDLETLDDLAAWLEVRLHETAGWTCGSRLYGLTVLDPDGVGRNADDAARFTFLAEGDIYALLDGPAAVAGTLFDALGLCCLGTATRLDTGERFRCRTVLVANEGGQSTVNRIKGSAPERMGRASGPIAEIVDGLFGLVRQREPQPVKTRPSQVG